MVDRHPPPPVAAIFFGTVVSTTWLAARLVDLPPSVWTAGIIAVTALLGLVATRTNFRWRRHALVAAVSLVAAHAAVLVAESNHPGDHPLVSWLGEERKSAELKGEIASGPIVHDRGVSFDLELTSIDIDEEGRLTEPPLRIRIFVPANRLPACFRPPLPGDRISVWADIRRFAPADVPWRISQRRLMEGRGLAASATAAEPLRFRESDPTIFRRLVRTLTEHRLELEDRVADHLDGDALAISTAMLTGSRGLLNPELREPFDVTSTGHILAISGLHFAVVAGLVAFVVRLIVDRCPRLYRRWPRRMLIGAGTLAVLVAYLVAIGAPVSARRAFGMTALAIAVICFSPWRLSPLSALATTAGLLLLVQPGLVLEAGFRLSVSATAGILAFLRFRPPAVRPPEIPGPTEEARHRRWIRRLLTFAGISVSATLATWPAILAMTGELPVAGLWTNLVVVPLVGSVLFPLLVAGALTTGIWAWAADLLLTVSTRGLLAIHAALDTIAYAPGSVIRWGTPTTLETLGLAGVVGLIVVGGYRLRALVVAGGLAVVTLVPTTIVEFGSPETTRVDFIDVGQGDATLVEAPDGTTVLVDGGGRPVGRDPGLTEVVPYLRHRGIDQLDAVVVTHPDYDHYGGLFATIRPFRPDRLLVDADVAEPRVRRLADEMRTAGAAVDPVDDPARIKTDNFDMTVLRPDLDGAEPNDRSLVVTLQFAGARVVLPGDLEARGESWLVDHQPGPAAILKAPHHGSNTSSTPRLLDHFQPAAAVASAGRHHHFGHPHPEVVERYEDRGIDLFRTDRHGATVVTIDEDGVVTVEPTRVPP